MLKIYAGKINKTVIDYNSEWFHAHTTKINFDDPVVKDMIHQIDEGDYVGNHMFTGKPHNGAPISVAYLSSGCKTAINIYSFTNKIFTLASCGRNALTAIFSLPRGSCHMSFFMLPRHMSGPINFIYNNKREVVDDFLVLSRMVTEATGGN